MRRDGEARDLWHYVYPRLSGGRPGLLGAVTARAEAQVMRLAGLYAAGDMSYVVGRSHLAAALEVWRYSFQSARYVFGGALGDPDADTILSALRRADDGLTRSDLLHRVFGRNKPAAEIARALSVLAHAGLAFSRTNPDTGGRPAERWFASEPTDDINDIDDITSLAGAPSVVNVVNVVTPQTDQEADRADVF